MELLNQINLVKLQRVLASSLEKNQNSFNLMIKNQKKTLKLQPHLLLLPLQLQLQIQIPHQIKAVRELSLKKNFKKVRK